MSDTEKKHIIELLEVYRSLPALWDVKSEEYSKRTIKENKYEVLMSKYREQYPNAEKKDLTRKINTLRTNYRRELKRKKDLEKSGTGGAFKTSLYYFDALRFLDEIDEIETPRKLSKPRSFRPGKGSVPKKKKTSATNELVILATKRLKKAEVSNHSIASVWAEKLSKIDHIQRIFAEKLINDVIFHGELGLLNFNTGLTNTIAFSDESRSSTPPIKSYEEEDSL